MPVINCICGYRLEGVDDNALFASYRSHTDEAHAQQHVSDEMIRGALVRAAGMTRWDGANKAADGEIEIRPLTPALGDDFLRFFDRDAFQDNPSWSGCYCLFYQFTGDDWAAATPEQNRAEKQGLIARGEAHGYLAYLDGAPVGWCHAAPRSTLPGLDRTEDFRCEGDPSSVGAIVCFNIAAPYRGQGLARQLLDAACAGLRADGFAIAEAYPARVSRSDARNYHGRLQMFLNAGFTLLRETEHFAIVRKTL